MTSKPMPSIVLFVADVARLTRFYRELAGMKLLHEDESHSVLEIDGLQMVVHAISGEFDVASEQVGGPKVREDAYLKLCLPVDGIAEARIRACALGGHVKSAEHAWEARGFRACDGHDPEGNVFQVRESAS